MFYIADEGPTGNLQGAADWQVVARDAHNGTLLWKRPVSDWYTHLAGWTSVPIQLQRRLVAAGDRVYVTLGYHAPVTALDAATGETVRVFEHPDGVDEIIWHKGVLIVAAKRVTDQRLAEYRKIQDWAKRRGGPLHERETGRPLINAFKQIENRLGRSIVAFDAQSGEQLWKLDGDDAEGLKPLSLRAVGSRVYFHRSGMLSCLELRSGKTIWSRKIDAPQAANDTALVCWNSRAVSLLSPQDGSTRWTATPVLVSVRDVFITKDSIWIGGFKPYDTGRSHTGPPWGPYFAVQRDFETGEIIKEIAPENPGHHQRCYISKATDRYILGGRRGTEFIDMQSGDYMWNSWARGVCRYGVMPANGLLYVPPHSCGCYITAKLTGFNAMSAERKPALAENEEPRSRREQGPAFGHTGKPPHPNDWPTYRGNSRRDGTTPCSVPTELRTTWQIPISAPLTAPTVANGKVFVACADKHTLVAIDAGTGETAWKFVTDGRIDSPPTIHNGQALLGCRDGSVYSLRVSDGSLAWRLRGSRGSQRIASHGQLESAWPVHGSVLVDNGVAYFTSGRSSYLDGGIKLHRLDPETGTTLGVTNVYSPDPETGLQPAQYNANQMPGSRSDILLADTDHVYLRDLLFNKAGEQLEQRAPHLFTLTDFLDDSWTHRSYWVFAEKSSISTGCSGRDRNLIYGRLLLYDDTMVYGYARKNVDWSNEFQDGAYHLYARARNASAPAWSSSVPIRVQAMVRAGDTLFVAGPDAEMVRQTEPPSGRQGGMLLAYSAQDGALLASHKLSATPVFDGMAAARGQLVLALNDGTVVCLAGTRASASE
jgi:outer membrane protein assembly factor BamB